jgi:hypothetical protein
MRTTFRKTKRPDAGKPATNRAFDEIVRALHHHDPRWVATCRARSLVWRCRPSMRTLHALGWCGTFFGGPLPVSPERIQARRSPESLHGSGTD